MNTDPFYLSATRTLTVLLPEFIVLATATIMMTAGAFVRLPRRLWCAIAAAALLTSMVALRIFWMFGTDPFISVALNDSLSQYGRLAFLFTGLILLGLAHDQVDDHRSAEFFGAILMIVTGSMLVCAANDLVFLFVGLELVSIPTYLLLYLPRRNPATQEAATKYFFLSVFSSGLLLFGLAYLYGLTGVSNLKAMSYVLQSAPDRAPLTFGLVAIVFVMAGLGFRVAAVPFHFYAPDVYQGSPLVMAGLLAWVPKGIGFIAMLRVLTAVIGGTSELAGRGVVLAWLLAVVTMTLGNTVALQQQNLKRLLAYSSIAHAGYLLIGVAAAFRDTPLPLGAVSSYPGAQGVVYYLGAYALMTLGVFGAIMWANTPDRPVETVDDLAGLGWSHPGLGLAMALCLFSLAGVPPLAGFWGKFYIFASALSASPGLPAERRFFQVLAIIGALNAAIGAYYYLRMVVVMYFRPAPENRTPLQAGWPTAFAAGVCAALSLVFGLTPEVLNSAAHRSAVAATTRTELAPLPVAPAEVTASVD